MTMLSSSSPVTATTMLGGRWMPARSSTKISVASPLTTTCSNSSSNRSNLSRRCSTSVTSWPTRRRLRARFAPILPPPAIRTYMSAADLHRLRHVARPDGVRQPVDRVRGRADRAHALLLVELGAGRIEQPDDDTVDAEALLDDLADHDVRVVAVGGDHARVGVLDPGAAQD